MMRGIVAGRLKGDYMTPPAALLVVLALAVPQETAQEKPKVPKDSVELTVVGCLKGRVLKTLDKRQTDVESGPYVGARSFHLASKKPVTDEIKRQQGHLVEVTGLVKRSALDDKGIKVGRVAIGGGSPVAGSRSMPSPADNVTVMDVSSVRMRASTCTPE
jgi:hypothetical protein